MSLDLWTQIVDTGGERLDEIIREYLEDELYIFDAKKLRTYMTRWRGYITNYKKPHYDAVMYRWLYLNGGTQSVDDHIEKRFQEELERLLAD